MKLDTRDYEARMKKSVAAYADNLSTIRAGRANPDVLKKISVDYYGSPTPISSIAEMASFTSVKAKLHRAIWMAIASSDSRAAVRFWG